MALEIRVHKSRKELELVEDGRAVLCVRVGIGKEEQGPKETRGDMRTPEGEYQVCVKNPKSRFHLSLGLNYPNEADARRGLDAGRISRGQFDSILSRNKMDGGSDWGTPLGGAIYIHGDLESQEWSHGCVRLLNADMEKLYERVEIGTPVKILP